MSNESLSDKTLSIDTRNIKQTDCELNNFPLQELKLTERPNGFQLVVCRSVLNQMKEHGRTSMHAEVGGMLVGNLYWDSEPFLLIKASIIGKYTDGNVASVTFTAETWNHVWQEQEKHYPETNIIGWYHTHPGFGIFLSRMDLFICEHTFNAPHQVAYVYDPQSEDEGWFIWKDSIPIKMKPLVIEDVPALPVTVQRENTLLQAAAEKIVITPKDTKQKLTTLLVIFIITSIVLFLVSTFCLTYLTTKSTKMQNEIVQLKQNIKELENKFKITEMQNEIMQQLKRDINELDNKFQHINSPLKYGEFYNIKTLERLLIVPQEMSPSSNVWILNKEQNKPSQRHLRQENQIYPQK
ncbi:MAG: Mov34/MPN/PAD-1 family protein [Planctomycetaceae bacterium]|jgi:proteasome lid subunit RPN8/RPN11/cell division protein FtsL|nr:Mov34/MPN/PAD-1 family protein [Planctomycetaceae bacterium]